MDLTDCITVVFILNLLYLSTNLALLSHNLSRDEKLVRYTLCKIHTQLNVYAKLEQTNQNLTSLYDMVTRMYSRQTSLEAEVQETKEELNVTKQELRETKEKLEEAERKINTTVEKLKIGNKTHKLSHFHVGYSMFAFRCHPIFNETTKSLKTE